MGGAVGVKRDYVPPAAELNAHVRTAVDGSVRWLDRALRQPGGDGEGWDRSTFFARTMLMRGIERGELLGWTLQRDALAAEGTDRAAGLRQATAYWYEARPDLHGALDVLRRAADLAMHEPAAGHALKEARERLDQARAWLSDLAEGLARTNRSHEIPREVERRPEASYGRDFL